MKFSIPSWKTLVVLAGIGAAAAGGYVFLPDFGLRWGVTQALTRFGLSDFKVGPVRFSPFSGRALLENLKTGAVADQSAGIGGLDFSFLWRPLLSRIIAAPRIDLTDVSLVLIRTPQGWQAAGFPEFTGGESGGPLSWSVDVGMLTVQRGEILVIDGDRQLHINVAELTLADVNSALPDVPSRMHLRGTIDGAAISVDGTATPFAAAPAFAVKLKLDGFKPVALSAMLGAFGLPQAVDCDLEIAAALGDEPHAALDGSLRLLGVKIPFDGGKVEVQSADWKGRIAYSTKAGTSLAGQLTAQNASLRDSRASIDADSLHADMQSATFDAAGLRLDWTGGLTAKNWRLSMSELSISHDSLSWLGRSHLDLSAKAPALFQAQGKAQAVKTKMTLPQGQVEAETLAAEGEFIHARPNGILPPMKGEMSIDAGGFSIDGAGRRWIAGTSLRINRLSLAAGAIAADRIRIVKPDFLAKIGVYGPRIRAASLDAQKLRMAADGAVSADSAILAAPVIRINRDRAGIQGLSDPVGGDGGSSKMAFKLGRLRLSDGRVEFRDRAPAVPVRLSFSNVDLNLGELNSAAAERDTAVSAQARLGDGKISVSGRIRPLRGLGDAQLHGVLENLELPGLSPYAVDSAGIEILTGRLNAQTDLTIRSEQLNGKVDLTIDGLNIARPDPSGPIVKAADMPVETVVDLLRDSDGRIKLSIPIRGNLASPDFDTGDAVAQVVGGALKSTIFTTLKVAFPLLPLIGLVIDEIDNPRMALPPLDFAAGDDQLPDDQRKIVAQVAKLLKTRDSVTLNLCGVAAKAVDGPILRRQAGLIARLKALMEQKDAEELEEFERNRLMRLAQSRADGVKDLLTGEYGIAPGRLYECRARIDAALKASPHVDLVF